MMLTLLNAGADPLLWSRDPKKDRIVGHSLLWHLCGPKKSNMMLDVLLDWANTHATLPTLVNATHAETGHTILMDAIRNGADGGIIKALITSGADVNYRSAEEGFTALHWAGHKDEVDAAQILVHFGHADFNILDSHGVCAYSLFAKSKQPFIDRWMRPSDDILNASENAKKDFVAASTAEGMTAGECTTQ